MLSHFILFVLSLDAGRKLTRLQKESNPQFEICTVSLSNLKNGDSHSDFF